jgi:hypothetical protein
MPRPSRFDRIVFAQEQHADRLLGMPNVTGVATGRRQRGGRFTDQVCVQVFVERKLPEDRLHDREIVPERIPGFEGENVRTDVIEITPPAAEQDTARYRPVRGGISIGPESRISAGTLGGWACDSTDDTIVLLSNNHVISNLDTMPVARRITQPGRFDGGTLPDDVIGELKRHIALATVANPPTAGLPAVTDVDAAIGTIDVDRSDEVIDIGPAVYELGAPAIDMNVQKRGRTTQLTTNARITSVNGTFNVTYQNGTRLGRVANTYVAASTDGNRFSQAGDSGSLVFDQAEGQLAGTRPAIGLHYAGGTFADGTPFSLGNDLNAVFGALNLSTVCDGVVRAIIRALFGGRRAQLVAEGFALSRWPLREKEAQLRRFRSRLLRATSFGKVIDEFVTVHAAEVGAVLTSDDEAFGLAVRTLEPWVARATNLDIIEASIDADTVGNVDRLARVLGRRIPDLQPQLESLAEAVRALEGAPVRRLLREGGKTRPARKQPRRPRKRT